MKKYKCDKISELPANQETANILMWFKSLSVAELERFSMDAFNTSNNHIFASACTVIFEMALGDVPIF